MRSYFMEQDEFEGEVHYYEFDGAFVAREIVVHPELTLLLTTPDCSELKIEDYDFTEAQKADAKSFQRLWDHYSGLPHSTRGDDHPRVQRALRRLRDHPRR